ncbi:hypothetical protein D3C71_1906370 [compost metagenome]
MGLKWDILLTFQWDVAAVNLYVLYVVMKPSPKMNSATILDYIKAALIKAFQFLKITKILNSLKSALLAKVPINKLKYLKRLLQKEIRA